MSNLDFPNAVKEIVAAAEYLRKTGSPKVGISGFCMGGALALGASVGPMGSGIDACAPFYGVNFQLIQGDLKKIPVQARPWAGTSRGSRLTEILLLGRTLLAQRELLSVHMQGHFGSEDKMAGFSDVGAAKKLEEHLKAAGVPVEVFIYEGCDHGFMNSDEGKAGDLRRHMNFVHTPAGEREKAWDRLISFFSKHLKH